MITLLTSILKLPIHTTWSLLVRMVFYKLEILIILVIICTGSDLQSLSLIKGYVLIVSALLFRQFKSVRRTWTCEEILKVLATNALILIRLLFLKQRLRHLQARRANLFFFCLTINNVDIELTRHILVLRVLLFQWRYFIIWSGLRGPDFEFLTWISLSRAISINVI